MVVGNSATIPISVMLGILLQSAPESAPVTAAPKPLACARPIDLASGSITDGVPTALMLIAAYAPR